MVNRKSIRTRGKISLARYFQKFEKGDLVAVVRERAEQPRFPEKLQGRTGVIKDKKGRAYIVSIKDNKMEKEYIITPIHLKKIKQDIKK